jgi:hypothetical protein
MTIAACVSAKAAEKEDYRACIEIAGKVSEYRKSLAISEEEAKEDSAIIDNFRDQFLAIYKSNATDNSGLAGLSFYWVITPVADSNREVDAAQIDADIKTMEGMPNAQWVDGLLRLERMRFLKPVGGKPIEEVHAAIKLEIEYLKSNMEKICNADTAPNEVKDPLLKLSGARDSFGAKALWYIAARFQALGNVDESIKYFEEIVKQYPDSAAALSATAAIKGANALRGQ